MWKPPADRAYGPAAGEIDYHKLSKCPDSDYESDPVSDSAEYKHEAINDAVQVT